MPTTQPLEFVKNAISPDQVLAPYVYVFYTAFIIAFILTPVMRSVAIYYNVIDKPDLVRKLHAQPVAYLGGVAVFMGWLAGLATTQFIGTHYIMAGIDDRLRIPMWMVAAAFVVMLLGLWDDTKHIRPRAKLVGQIVAAILLLANGIGTTVTQAFLVNLTARLDTHLGVYTPPEVLHWIVFATSSLFTVGLVMFCCNASNLMDGLDGLCGGVTAIIAAGFIFLAVVVAQHTGVFADAGALSDFVNREGVRVAIAVAMLGGILGFVPYNFNPASIFLGDAGSMFLGFLCALMILLLGEVHGKWFLAGMVMFALPVLDTSLAFARRYVAGRPFFSADRHHFHHQLIQRGLSVKQAVLVSYALTTFFVLCGITMVFLRTRYALAFYLVLFGSIVVTAYKMGMVHERVIVEKPSKMTGDNVATAPTAEISPEGILEIRSEKPLIEMR